MFLKVPLVRGASCMHLFGVTLGKACAQSVESFCTRREGCTKWQPLFRICGSSHIYEAFMRGITRFERCSMLWYRRL